MRETIAGQQAYIVSLAKGYDPDSIKLTFKDPLRSGKAFLGEGRPHRLDPFGEGHERNYDGFKTFCDCGVLPGDIVTCTGGYLARPNGAGSQLAGERLSFEVLAPRFERIVGRTLAKYGLGEGEHPD